MASVKDKLGTVGGLQPLLGRLGVGDVHARTSGPSRSPRTGAAPATAPSCTGPPASPSKGGIRSQFCHVIDVAPTVLEAAGLPEPDVRERGAAGADRGHQHALQLRRRRTRRSGTTCSTSRWPATAASTSRAGARSPGTAPPGCRTRCCPRWTTTSGSSTTATPTGRRRSDLAAEQPDRLAALQRLWLIEAVKYNVLPIDDRRFERLNADHRRPAAADHRDHARCCSPG